VEQLGIPTVTIATTEFLSLAKDTALSQGAADTCFTVVPHPMGMIPLEEIRKKAEEAFPEIFRAATEWKPSPAATLASAKTPYPAERFKFKGTWADVNKLYYEKGWSLGLPIAPPTSERVAEMLKGTTRSPQEVIGTVPPREGVLTVELVAAYAAMANAKPEYMPVILAAAEAMVDPKHGWRGSTTTTNPVAPLLLVNGPIVRELGIQYSTGALGGGPNSHPNISIGHAINLVGDVSNNRILSFQRDRFDVGLRDINLGKLRHDSDVPPIMGIMEHLFKSIHDILGVFRRGGDGEIKIIDCL